MIELQRVRKTFLRPGGEPIHALDDVSFRIERGDLLAIVGSSGSGKSTLMNLLGLLDVPSDGSVRFAGQEVAALGVNEQARLRNKRIGFVFQAFRLLPRMTARENVELPLIYSDRASIKGLAAAALASVGLSDRTEHWPSQLSGGQQQRVAIARALVNEPDIILADEPTGNLDAHAAREVMDLFQRLNRGGVTVVIVTHDDKVAAHCRRIARLECGKIVADEAVVLPRSEDAPAEPGVA